MVRLDEREDNVVFISHSSRDELIIAAVREAFSELNIKPYFIEDEAGGAPPTREIANRIKGAKALFVFFTEQSLHGDTRDWIIFEIGVAEAHSKPIYTWKDAQYKEEHLPKLLQQVTTYRDLPPISPEYSMKLVKSIRTIASQLEGDASKKTGEHNVEETLKKPRPLLRVNLRLSNVLPIPAPEKTTLWSHFGAWIDIMNVGDEVASNVQGSYVFKRLPRGTLEAEGEFEKDLIGRSESQGISIAGFISAEDLAQAVADESTYSIRVKYSDLEGSAQTQIEKNGELVDLVTKGRKTIDNKVSGFRFREKGKWFIQLAPKTGAIERCQVSLGGSILKANSERFVETLLTTENFFADVSDKNDTRQVVVTERGNVIFKKPFNELSILSET